MRARPSKQSLFSFLSLFFLRPNTQPCLTGPDMFVLFGYVSLPSSPLPFSVSWLPSWLCFTLLAFLCWLARRGDPPSSHLISHEHSHSSSFNALSPLRMLRDVQTNTQRERESNFLVLLPFGPSPLPFNVKAR